MIRNVQMQSPRMCFRRLYAPNLDRHQLVDSINYRAIKELSTGSTPFTTKTENIGYAYVIDLRR